ncbi:MAG TPA: Mur ligase family protein [Spirochaetia bacterium]|nr:Mur ligase family protein [Spirochaetia bacterium]
MTGFDARLFIALIAGRIAGWASRNLKRGGGTTLPGLIALRIDHRVLAKLSSRLPNGTILVTGTNGKTTTSRLLAATLSQSGESVIHNRSGANLLSGITTALLMQCSLTGRPHGNLAVFEVDEAVLPRVIEDVGPEIVMITNLFRDQLDRFGEVDYLAGIWKKALGRLPTTSTVILNMDDPTLASLGMNLAAQVIGYGIEAENGHNLVVGSNADSKSCPVCGGALRYSRVQYAHLGSYTCPNGDFERPSLDLAVTSLVQDGVDSTELEIKGPFGLRSWRIGLPGRYNGYNVLAAVSGAVTAGVSLEAIDKSIDNFHAAFGRFERIHAMNRILCIVLVKNPVGFTEVVRTILEESGDPNLAILINDNLADGTDVSWLWDVDVEGLSKRCRHVIVGGARAGDMAVRLKYAGVPADRIELVETVEQGIDRGLAGTPDGRTLYALPTYTAMLELRAIAAKRHYAESFWEA